MIALVFIGCSSDDDDGGVSVEGTWKLTAFRSQNAYDLTGNGVISNDVMGQTNCYQNERLTFNANGTGADISTSYLIIDLELTAGSISEYEYSFECISENNTSAFTWTQSGANVTVTTDGFSFTGVQNGTKITFTIPNGFEIPVEQGDEIVWITENLTMEYTKQ